jgi:hypothetical protein
MVKGFYIRHRETMKSTHFSNCWRAVVVIVGFMIAIFPAYCQQQGLGHTPLEVPENYRLHPEFGQVLPSGLTNNPDFELIHLRTTHTRTFRNRTGSTTMAWSSEPLHYRDESGFFRTLDYSFTTTDGATYLFPNECPVHNFSNIDGSMTFYSATGSLVRKGNSIKVKQFDSEGRLLQSLEADHDSSSTQITSNRISVLSVIPTLDMHCKFGAGYRKTDYHLNSKALFHPDAFTLLIEEELILPAGWSLSLGSCGTGDQVNVIDVMGIMRYMFQQPVLTDGTLPESRGSEQRPHHFGSYSFERTEEGSFLLRVSADVAWLTCPSRIYPVVIDPVVVQIDTTVMNSCFGSNYQTGIITLPVPQGTYIFNTYLEWDFTATSGSQAWMSDQLSYVSGPTGQTPVFSGSGNSAGTQTYTVTNSTIANGTSMGAVPVTFHAARTWGGSGCNATFNFIARRYVEITYDSLNFGQGQVVINEYSASNRTIPDNFGRTEDWVELYNPSPYFMDLTGYHMSDDPNDPTKWQITAGFIPPQGRVVVWCSGRDISSGTVFHTSFRLSQLKPEYIMLSDSVGQVLEVYLLQTTQVDHSYGRIVDGAMQWGIFDQPTPWQANVNAKTGYTSTPQVSVSAGHYTSAQTIAITAANPGEEIRYTTNGFEPTLSSSLYAQPLQLNQTAVVRARAFSSDTTLLPGFITTSTYLINEHHTLPVFSFAGNNDLIQLFNGNQNLIPLGSFEFFDEQGNFIDNSFGDFNKHGNDSWSYPQRGVDFISRDDYGYNDALRHKFFATSDRTSFQRLMVKAAANDNYPFETGGAHIRDSYVQTLSQLSGLNLDERSSTNVIVYVNGQYWGVYDLREKVDDHDYTDYYYAQDRQYGGSDLWLQFLKTWGSTQAAYGNQPAMTDWSSLRQYIQNNSMSDPVHFAYVDSLLDITSLIDYFVINSFVVSRDWLNYNTGWWRGLDPDGAARRWRYILWDQEGGLGHYINFTGMPDITANASPCQVEHLTVNNNGHVQSIRKLIQENPSIRQRYVTRYADLLNTHFSCTRIVELLDSMVSHIAPEMPRHLQRWNAGSVSQWQSNVDDVRTFLLTRCTALVTGLATCYNLTGPYSCIYNVQPAGSGKIKMNSEWLRSYPFQAAMYGNIQTLLQAEPAPGYVFSHWEIDSATADPGDSVPNISLMFTTPTSITAHFINPYLSDDTLIHYWHFNNLVTPGDVVSIKADTTIMTGAFPLMTYLGTGPRDMDVYSMGAGINLHQQEAPGSAVRVRNPSDGRAVVFDLPTNAFKDIRFAYATHRSGQGMLQQHLSYSIDGHQFITTGMDTTVFDVDETYRLIALDFSGIAGVNNNPDFKIRIDFIGNTTASNGNNRFDNITLKGRFTDVLVEQNKSVPMPEIKVFPNPASRQLYVELKGFQEDNLPAHLSDITGRLVIATNISPGINTLDLYGIKPGIYLLRTPVGSVRVVITQL